MAFDLITLIMLIVPGFWSMWIYQAQSYKDIESRQWESKGIMALSFGLINLVIAYSLAAVCVRFASCSLTPLHEAAQAIIAGKTDSIGIYAMALFFLIVASIVTAALAIVCDRKGWFPNRWLPRKLQKKSDELMVPYDFCLDGVFKQFEGKSAVVLYYKLGHRDEALAGYCVLKSCKEKEMCLLGTHLFTKDHPLFQGYQCFSFVKHGSDYVFEIFPVENEVFNTAYQELVNEYARTTGAQ